jgi:hypothetical protein
MPRRQRPLPLLHPLRPTRNCKIRIEPVKTGEVKAEKTEAEKIEGA